MEGKGISPLRVFWSLSKRPFFEGSFCSASLGFEGFEADHGDKLRPRGGSSTPRLQLGNAWTGLPERLVS